MVSVCPAIVTVPVRAATVGFACGVNVSVPAPDPLALDTLSHGKPFCTVQLQPALDSTPICAPCAPGPNDSVVGLIA